MEDFDLVIANGTIATATDTYRADIGIRNGEIACIARGLGERPGGAEVIDATGRLVLPGAIETHCHIEQESATGGMTSDDYLSGSTSAAFGGHSCILPFAAQHRGMGIFETLELYDGRAAPKSVIDYSYHLIVSDPTEAAMAELPRVFERGITSFKVFMTYDRLRVTDAQFLDILALAGRHGALTMVHAENNDMIKWTSERLVQGGYSVPRYHAVSHPALAEEEAINRAVTLAKFVNAPLFVVHVSTPEGAAVVQRARLGGTRVFAETCPQYLFLTRDDLDRPGMEGAKFMCSPPLRDRATQEALWRHVQAGTFSTVTSDHAPYRFDETGKLSNGPEAPFNRIANGMPGIAMRCPLLFSEGVGKGRITLNRFVELTATAPARIFGLAPRKGSIHVGADADIAIWDPGLARRVSLVDQHDNMDYTPYEGMEITGWPVTVINRGRQVVREGRLLGAAGDGAFVTRGRTDLTGLPGRLPPELDPSRNFGAGIGP